MPPISLTEVNPASRTRLASAVTRIAMSCGLVTKASGMLAL